MEEVNTVLGSIRSAFSQSLAFRHQKSPIRTPIKAISSTGQTPACFMNFRLTTLGTRQGYCMSLTAIGQTALGVQPMLADTDKLLAIVDGGSRLCCSLAIKNVVQGLAKEP